MFWVDVVSQVALAVKNLLSNAGDIKRHGFDPWVGKIFWRRKWQSTQYCCLENPMDRGAWWAAVHGVTQTWTRLSDLAHMHNWRAIGEGLGEESES